MELADVLGLQSALADEGLDWCVCGGWGVDALLGEHTRPHKDLDVLVDRADLPRILAVLTALGYHHAYTWEENVPLDGTDALAGTDSAFVMEDSHGGELDIHVYAAEGANVVPLWAYDARWPPAAVAAPGRIGEREVRCLALELQLEHHTGYELPPAHRADVARLEDLRRSQQ